MIDTENKRRSVQAYSGRVMYPRPGTSVTGTWREHVSRLYAGIAPALPAVIQWVTTNLSLRIGLFLN